MSIVKILSGAALASAALLVAPAATQAASFTSLYTFTGGNDGSSPFGRLTLRYNEIFGAAYDDGASGDGVLFTTNP